MKKVCVLMSTYNGEKYLREQIDSILNQIDVEVYLYIRDDGSTDTTINIIEKYMYNNSNIEFVKGENVGILNSFMYLVNTAKEYDYYAFADQDDVWDKDKLICAVSHISNNPASLNQPFLYNSNLRVVDEELNYLGIRYFRSYKQKYKFIYLNYFTGCTIVFNNNLLHLVRKSNVDKCCGMHDSWIGLIAAFLGNIIYDPVPHLSYRQHANNYYGGTEYNLGVLGLNLNLKQTFYDIKQLFKKNNHFKQNRVKYFYSQYLNYINENLSARDINIIKDICVYNSNPYAKLRLLFNKEFIDNDTFRGKVYYFLQILFNQI